MDEHAKANGFVVRCYKSEYGFDFHTILFLSVFFWNVSELLE